MPTHLSIYGSIWESVLDRLQQMLDAHDYKNWFADKTTQKSYEQGILVVNVASSFFADWLRDHYLDKVIEVMRELDEEFQSVTFQPDEGLRKALEKSQGSTAGRIIPRQEAEIPRPELTLDEFVQFPGNFMAKQAAISIVEAAENGNWHMIPKVMYLWGLPGAGKSALADAIAYALAMIREQNRKANPRLRRFTQRRVSVREWYQAFQNMLSSLRSGGGKAGYDPKNYLGDVVVFHDLHFIADGNKQASRTELRNIIKEITEGANKGLIVIITAHVPPHQLKGLEPEMVSILEQGSVERLTLPTNYDAWLELFKGATDNWTDTDVGHGALELLAQVSAGKDIRAMLGCLSQAKTMLTRKTANANGQELLPSTPEGNGRLFLTEAMVRRVLTNRGILGEPIKESPVERKEPEKCLPGLTKHQHQLTEDGIIEAVAAHFKVNPSLLRRGGNCDPNARQIAIYLCHTCRDTKAGQLKAIFGVRNPNEAIQEVWEATRKPQTGMDETIRAIQAIMATQP